MDWTTEQSEAINTEGTNIIVSAGAGSGKTAVLSERVLRKVKEGVDIRRILMLTFTNEAAGEMKNRIRKKIKEAGLIEELEYIDAAYITTFDAYALAITKKYHYALNISPNISLIDASIIDLEKERILEEIFLELYEQKDEDFLKLIGDFTTRDDKTIKEAILNINKSLDLKYEKIEYLDQYIAKFYKEEYIDGLIEEYFQYLKSLTESLEADIYAIESMVDEKLYLKIYDAYAKFFNPKNYNDLYRIKDVPTVQFRNIPEEALPLKESIKDTIKEIRELTLYSEEEIKEQLMKTKSYVKAIIKIIRELEKRINAYKIKHESFEFLDIAKMAIRIVKENEDIREELKNFYNEILIDEYQDTNDLQELFIKEIENNNVYMVGDIKQSIYRFRNANPDIFKNKYAKYSRGYGGIKIDLLSNFRSRKEVLANINTIFNLLMTDSFGGVDYEFNHEMIYGNLAYEQRGATDYNNNLEVLKYDNEDKEYSNAEIEAFVIAKDIIAKIKSGYQVYDFDLKDKRPLKYSDCCIILDRGADMPLYKKIFEYFNIPMDVYKDSNLVSSDDILIIKNILNLIMAIKNEIYDTKMRYYFTSIARSFVGDLTDSEIFNHLTNNTFYETSIYKKCAELARDIDLKSPNMLLNEIIIKFEFFENFIKVGNISDAMERLDYILDISSNVEQLGFTVEDFLTYLETMVNFQKEIRYKENRGVGNCVKIMNIHKSKGLEFPICYFAGFKKDFNLKDLQSRFMFDNKYGILTPFYQEGIGTLITKTLIKNKYYQEEISEKIRLFYVALTRAKEKMIMVTPNFDKKRHQKGPVPSYIASNYRSFYDFLSSISLNLSSYMKIIDLKELNLTKDYEFVSKENRDELKKSDTKITFIENKIETNMITNKHASKTINSILTLEEAKTLEYGTSIHNYLEMVDFKDLTLNNKYVNNLQKTFDFKHAVIYKEHEFIIEIDNQEYHGIIDLMLEYEDNIKIIDYKLKNIDDEAYIKQLGVYYKYLKTLSDKKIEMYLYSILDNRIKEVAMEEVVT